VIRVTDCHVRRLQSATVWRSRPRWRSCRCASSTRCETTARTTAMRRRSCSSSRASLARSRNCERSARRVCSVSTTSKWRPRARWQSRRRPPSRLSSSATIYPSRACVTWRVTWSAKQWRPSPRRRSRRRRTITNCLESELRFLVRLLFVHTCNNNYYYYHYTVLANLAFWLVCVCVLVYRIVAYEVSLNTVVVCIYVRQRTFISSIDRCYWCPLCSGWSFVTSHPKHGPCPSCSHSSSVDSRLIDLRRCSRVAE